jgi:anaerobic magnesium-protoporphyrin IX monomethyl ester cyclase
MRVLLFYPRGYDNTNAQAPIASLAVNLPSIGLAGLAAVLRAGGHEIRLIDAGLHRRVTNEAWARRIVAWQPDLVGFSAITSHFCDAYDVCRRVKEIRAAIPTVFGGAHVSWGQASILENFPAIDYLIAGEGEQALAALADRTRCDQIEGLYFRDGATIRHGPPRTTLCTMDELPFPAYDLIEGFPRRYNMALFSYPRYPGATVISSRGCIYQCDYCDRSVFNRSFRWNSPEYTAELVGRLAADFGIRHVMFYDDLFTLNRGRVARLCSLLAGARRRVSFNCIVRIGHIDDELIALLKSAGCWMVHVGIESGDQAILDRHKQGLSLADIRRDVQKLHQARLWIKGLFMMGFPGETESSIAATIDFACSLPLKDANVTAFTPYPGAPISAEIAALGTLDDDWSKMDCVNFVFVPHSIGSRAILDKYYAAFIRRFYNRPFMRAAYRRMVVQSPHSYWRLLKSAPAFLGYARAMKAAP